MVLPNNPQNKNKKMGDQIDAKAVDTQAVLLAGVKAAVDALTRRTLGVPEEGCAEAQPIPKVLDDKVKEVRNLLMAVEMALFHGLRVEEFKGVFPFWALLERLEGAIQPTDHNFNNVIAAVAVVLSYTCIFTLLSFLFVSFHSICLVPFSVKIQNFYHFNNI